MIRLRRQVFVGLGTLLLLSCVEPALLDEDTEAPATPPDTTAAVPVDESSLRAELDVLHEQLAATSAALTRVANTDDLAVAHDLGVAARTFLVGDAQASDGPPPILPSQTPDRAATLDQPGLLISVLTEARTSGTSFSNATVAMLSDDLAGDLGAWQRDPEGMIDFATSVASSTHLITELEVAILELPGEGTRALAWIEVLIGATDLESAVAAASRANTHIELVLAAVNDLTSVSAPTPTTGTS